MTAAPLVVDARVVAVEADCAWVQLQPHSPCGHCDPVHGCRSLSIARLFRAQAPTHRVDNPLAAQVGHRVEVALSAQEVLTSAVWVYLLPLCALLGGALLGTRWGDGIALACALLGWGLAFAVTRWWTTHHIQSAAFQPRITRIFSDDDVTLRDSSPCQPTSPCSKN